MPTIPSIHDRQAVLFAPHGRDAHVAQMLLAEAQVATRVCANSRWFCESLGEDALFAVVTEEALLDADLKAIAQYVVEQPAWSSLPFIVLTRHGASPERNRDAARLTNVLQNVALLERPFHGTTFVSMAQAALRSRLRQFEARTSEEKLKASEEALRKLNETLEQRVAERTAALERAHAMVLAEISQREQAEEELRQAQKMEVIGQLTGGVAHDFNNLLMAVMSNLELLAKHHAENESAAKLIDGAMQGAQRGATLTQRLLAFARRQDLTVEPRDLSALVKASEDLLRHSLGPSVELDLNLQEDIPLALVDENQFDLALLNLVVNARDAMPDGGVIRILVDHVPPEIAEQSFGHVRLRVEDQGCGMDKKTLEQATQPFFSTKERGKGTGLGLSMIHGLAIQLGGKLILTSKVGKGTTADLLLPASDTPIGRVERPAPPATSPDEKSDHPLRILFVDDDVLIAMSSVELLEDLGHEVVEANSGAQALSVLEKGEAFDLMITDFSMPKMNGGQLSVAARKIYPDLPILLATGYAELPDGEELELPRLAKPYAQRQLRDAIQKLLS